MEKIINHVSLQINTFFFARYLCTVALGTRNAVRILQCLFFFFFLSATGHISYYLRPTVNSWAKWSLNLASAV